MNIEVFRNYCLQKKGVTEEFPFGPDTLVYKVYGKIFALTNVELFGSINLKCDPEEAVLLRENYTSVIPGYHMNKNHWNTVLMDNSVPDAILNSWIDNSYNLVIKSLPKKVRTNL